MKPTQEEIVKNYIRLVYYYAKQWVTNTQDVDDMVHETYKKVFMHYDTFSYKSDSQLKSWILTICRNTIYDAHKLKKQTIVLDEDIENSYIDHADSWLEGEIKNEEIQSLQEALLILDTSDGDIIRLRYFDDLSFKEIAIILKITAATAKMRCYRAIAKLRKELEK